MATRSIPLTGLRILAVCLLFVVCFAIAGALSRLDKIAQIPAPSQSAASTSQQLPPAPENLLRGLFLFTVCCSGVLSYLILRSRWHGWKLAGAICLGMYGIFTVANQLDSVALLSNKLPQGMIRALFVQGAIASALFAPLAVLVLGKWRGASPLAPHPMKVASLLLRVVVLIFAFVFLYMLFGYYVAWQNPELRSYYGGPEHATFWESLRYNWATSPWIYALAAFRALICIGCLYPLVRMLRASRWESALAAALFLACWTTALLLPNPMMPSSVTRSHFWETLGFSFVFGPLAGWLLCSTAPEQLVASNETLTAAASKP